MRLRVSVDSRDRILITSPSTVRIASCLHETFCGMLVVL